ncbi:MAG TPA: hypothetical protein VF746_07890 [Longimicrobium sp.]
MTDVSAASEPSPAWSRLLRPNQWVRVQLPGGPVEGLLIRADAGEVVLRDDQGRVQSFPFHGIEALSVLRLGVRLGPRRLALFGALVAVACAWDELIIERDPVWQVLLQILMVGGVMAALGAAFGMLLFGWKEIHPAARDRE